MKTVVLIMFLILFNLLFTEIWAQIVGWRPMQFDPYPVEIISTGRIGNVVSSPWMGNGYGTRLEINMDGREWVRVWSWEVRPVAEKPA